MIEAKHTAIPIDYVVHQRDYNSFHSDGRKVAYAEDACKHVQRLIALARPLGRTASFLDAGCRMGYVMDELLTHFPRARVVGIDVVPEFVEEARVIGDAVIGDICALTFQDLSFEWVFCSQTLEHAYNTRAAIEECLRVASVGVMFIVPLESAKSMRANKSHNARARQFEWLNVIGRVAGRDWWLVRAGWAVDGMEVLMVRAAYAPLACGIVDNGHAVR